MEEQRNEKDVNDNNVNENEEQETVDNKTSVSEETKIVSNEDDSVKKTDNDDVESNDEDSEIVEDEDSDKSGFSLPDNINWKSILIWGVVGFVFAFILVFLVSLISGTLAFVLGRLFLFGIIFFVVGAGIRLLLQIFAPEVFEEENEESHLYNDDISNISEENSDIGNNINTSIDDKIETDPLWSEEKKEDDKKSSKNVSENEKIKSKFGKDSDYIKVDGSDAVFPNNAELMAEGIRTMINKDEDN